MSNFQSQEKLSEYAKDILIDFLMTKGFVGEMRMSSKYIELSDEKIFVEIPNEPMLSEVIVKDVLQKSGLTFTEFEEHLRSVEALERMNSLIDAGLGLP